MGLGIRLQGRYQGRGLFRRGPSAEGLLQEIAAWYRDRYRDVLEDAGFGLNEHRHAMAWIRLHPAEEDLELSVPATGVVVASARTSGAGPGYHAFLCRTLQAASRDLGFSWDMSQSEDETGFFQTGDLARLEEAMVDWLGVVCGQVLDLQGQEYTGLQISLPSGTLYQPEGAVATPMGSRSVEWLRRVADDPRCGAEHFPWWSEARDASFFLNRALYRMWTAVHWREPLQDGEYEDLISVHDDLEQAYRLDPSLTYPWREWLEILPHVPREIEFYHFMVARAREARGPLVGYRRRNVHVQLADSGWSIEIPGSLAEKGEEDGRWVAWEGDRTIWVSTYGVREASGRPTPSSELLDSLTATWDRPYTEWGNQGVAGRARLTAAEENGERVNHLEALSAVPGRLASCNVFFVDPNDRDWAIRTWQTLTCPVADD